MTDEQKPLQVRIVPLTDLGDPSKGTWIDIKGFEKVEFGGGYVLPPELADYLKRKFGLQNG